MELIYPRDLMPWYRDWLFYSLLVVVFILDRVSKEIIRSSVAVGTSWPDDGFFRIVHGLIRDLRLAYLQDSQIFLSLRLCLASHWFCICFTGKAIV